MSTVEFRTLSTSKYWNKTPMEFKAQPQIFKHLQCRLQMDFGTDKYSAPSQIKLSNLDELLVSQNPTP